MPGHAFKTEQESIHVPNLAAADRTLHLLNCLGPRKRETWWIRAGNTCGM